MKDPEDKNAFVVDEEAAEVVRNIFHWFVDEGMSKLGITKKLTEMGIPTPTAYKHSKGLNLQTPRISKNDGMWGITTVCTILKNEMYIGNMVQGKQKVISYKVHEKVSPPKEEYIKYTLSSSIVTDKILNFNSTHTYSSYYKSLAIAFLYIWFINKCSKSAPMNCSTDCIYYAVNIF